MRIPEIGLDSHKTVKIAEFQIFYNYRGICTDIRIKI